jgi:hypothetical protein
MRPAKLGKLGVVILVCLPQGSIKGATCWAVVGRRFGLLESDPCFVMLRVVRVALDGIPCVRRRRVQFVTLTVGFRNRRVELLMRDPYGLLMAALRGSDGFVE